MAIVEAFFKDDLEEWADWCPEEGVHLYWWGKKAASRPGREDSSRVVFLDILLANKELRDDDAFDESIVAYRVPFSLHKTVRVVLNNSYKREAVLAAHQAAVKAAETKLEKVLGLRLVAVEAKLCSGIIKEIVFAACGWEPDGRVWKPFNTQSAFMNVVKPAVRKATETYQRRLGVELIERLGFRVAYEVIPDTGIPVAVVKYYGDYFSPTSIIGLAEGVGCTRK